jgi:hypothetical protein
MNLMGLWGSPEDYLHDVTIGDGSAASCQTEDVANALFNAVLAGVPAGVSPLET